MAEIASVALAAAAAVAGASNGAGSPHSHAGPVYVYAITAPGPGGDLPATGIDPQCGVERLPVGDVQAVVSYVRPELFNEPAVHAGLQDKSWLATHVLAHQAVIDALVRSGQPVIPMRFCTIYPGAPALVDSLARHQADLAAELARIAGKQEWGVKQMVDVPRLKAAIAEGHPTLAGVAMDGEVEKLRRQIAGMSPGAAFLLKKRLDNLVAERAQSVAFAIADATMRSLEEVAVAAVSGDLPDDRPDVVLNAAFWVENDGYDAFLARLEMLAQGFADVGVRYDLSGPWPPHHFLHLAFGQDEAV